MSRRWIASLRRNCTRAYVQRGLIPHCGSNRMSASPNTRSCAGWKSVASSPAWCTEGRQAPMTNLRTRFVDRPVLLCSSLTGSRISLTIPFPMRSPCPVTSFSVTLARSSSPKTQAALTMKKETSAALTAAARRLNSADLRSWLPRRRRAPEKLQHYSLVIDTRPGRGVRWWSLQK